MWANREDSWYGIKTHNPNTYTMFKCVIKWGCSSVRAIASKVSKELKEERIIKSRAIALAFETSLIRMAVEQIEGDVAQDSEGFRRSVQADTGSILGKGDIQRPVKSVFNGPMGASGIKNTLGMGRQAG